MPSPKAIEIEMQLNGCWICTSHAKDKDGYIQIGYEGKAGKRLHRVVMERILGRKLNEDEHVMHSCDTPACCRPFHLSVGTTQENTQDSVNKNRRLIGAKNPNTKLTPEQVREIRLKLSERTNYSLGKEYGVDENAIKNIRLNKTWRHLV